MAWAALIPLATAAGAYAYDQNKATASGDIYGGAPVQQTAPTTVDTPDAIDTGRDSVLGQYQQLSPPSTAQSEADLARQRAEAMMRANNVPNGPTRY